MDWCVIRSQPILAVTIIDRNLDRYGGIDETNDSGRNPDEVGVTSVRGASKSVLA